MPLTVYNTSRQDARLAWNGERALTFGSRFKGLLGRKGLVEGGGLHISPCNSIHMFFMKFADELSDIRSQNFLHRTCFSPNHMHFDATISK